MKNETQIINYTGYNIADITKWNEEIRIYNEERENDDELIIQDIFLKYQIMDASNYMLTKAYNLEKQITYDLHECLQDGYFVNLDKRIKSRSRIETKIYNKFIKSNREVFNVASEVDDILRYTIIFDFKDYISQVDAYLSRLEESGYTIYKLKNRWNEPFYKGINVKIKNPNDFLFEIQFHTEENLEIIEHLTREPYKISRSNNAPIHLKIKAYLIRNYYQNDAHVPVGALEYQYTSNKNKFLIKE